MVYGDKIIIFERLRFMGARFDGKVLVIEIWDGINKAPKTREVVVADDAKHQGLVDGLVQVQMGI